MEQINAEVVRMTSIDVGAKLLKLFDASNVNGILHLAKNGKLDQQ